MEPDKLTLNTNFIEVPKVPAVPVTERTGDKHSTNIKPSLLEPVLSKKPDTFKKESSKFK